MKKRTKIDEGMTRLDYVPELTEKIWSRTKGYEGKPWALPKNKQPLVNLIGHDKTLELYNIDDKVAQNVHLRSLLVEPLKDEDHARRLTAIKWVIYQWGGITKKGNDDEKWPELFGNYEENVLAAFIKEQKNERIASWSKIFAFVDSEKYAIYDARVVISLNSILDELGDRNRFYMPTTKIVDLLHAMAEKGLAKNVLDAEMRLFANFDIHANRFAAKYGFKLPYPEVPFD